MQRRYLFTSRLEAGMTAFVSPVERWPDRNYAPEVLAYVSQRTPESFTITTTLHGFDAEDVRIDLSRGCVLILLSPKDNLSAYRRKEYYCEIPVPEDINGNEACVEISIALLTIRLNPKSGVLNGLSYRLRSFRNDLALCFGKGWSLESLDK